MDYVRLGQITKTFGLLGQLRCYSLTSFAMERFKKGTKVSLLDEKSGQREDVTINFFRDSGSYYFLGFSEYPSIEAAAPLVGRFIEIDKAKAPLPHGLYRLEDLKGLAVVDEKGTKLGEVIDVLFYSSTGTLKVRRDGKADFYVPFVMDLFILSLDLAKKEITIKVIPGLL
jgi:16S rRNA processing protein RimM